MQNELDLAKKEIEKGDFLSAVSLLKKIKITTSNIDEIYFHFAKAYFYLKDFYSAQKYLQTTIKSKDIDIIRNYSKYYLAKIYIKQEKYLKAFNLIKNANNINIKNELEEIFCFFVNKATLFNIKGKYDKVKKLYENYNGYFNNIENVFLKNKFLNEYELATKQTVLKSRPRSFLIALSNACNLKCIMCNQNKEVIKHISKNFIQLVIDNLPYCEKIFWQGGETLILPYLQELLTKTIKYRQIHQTIITNFQVVKDIIIELLIENNIRLIISIDSAKKENYEKIRVGAKFDKLIKNIDRLNSFQKKLNKYIFMQINFVIMKENFNEIIDILYFAKKYNFKMVSFIQEEHDNWKERQQFNSEEKKKILELLRKASKVAKDLNVNIEKVLNFDICKSKKTYYNNVNNSCDKKSMYCYLPWYKITLSYEDLISVDLHCKKLKINRNFYINNIYDLWNSKIFVNYRKQIVQGNTDFCKHICKHVDLNYKHCI